MDFFFLKRIFPQLIWRENTLHFTCIFDENLEEIAVRVVLDVFNPWSQAVLLIMRRSFRIPGNTTSTVDSFHRECAKKIDRVYRVLHDITMDKIRVHTCCPSCLKDIFCKLHKFLSTFAGRLQLLLNCDGILFSSSKIWNRQCFCCLEKMLVKMFPHQKRLMRT